MPGPKITQRAGRSNRGSDQRNKGTLVLKRFHMELCYYNSHESRATRQTCQELLQVLRWAWTRTLLKIWPSRGDPGLCVVWEIRVAGFRILAGAAARWVVLGPGAA